MSFIAPMQASAAVKTRGSVSLALLCGGVFLLVLAQLALAYAIQYHEKTLFYARNAQLNLLAETALTNLPQEQTEKLVGEGILANLTLEPNARPVQVKLSRQISDDGCFSLVVAEAALTNGSDAVNKQVLQRTDCVFSDELQELATTYAAVCGNDLTGTEYLSEDVLYASNREVTFPQIDFWSSIGVEKPSADDIADSGLSQRFYYFDSGNTYSVAQNQKVWGSALWATDSSTVFSIGSGAYFRDRMIFFCRTPIFIGSDVTFSKVLIFSTGKITVGSGCNINGLLVSKTTIEFQGPCTLTRDETAVAPFSSIYFIKGDSL